MIVKAILDLKQEVDSLRAELHAVSGTPSAGKVIAAVPEEGPEEQAGSYEEAPHAELSIKEMGDEAIERALARHGGKVGPAARELGISERTIYRKLAQKKQK